MIKGIIHKLVGDRKSRLMKRVGPQVDQVTEWGDHYTSLEDKDFPVKTEEFIERIKNGETTDDLLPEAFGLVYEACRRHVGRSWEVVGQEITWEMVPFDVQIAGAIVLHQGTIAEMATGEGKTLVATMPLYLNALEKKGAHLVTVNDYLARRDSEWMGEIYRFLGLTVGCLQNDMLLEEKQLAYNCDITYGTNNEFGFDYLRDNMKWSKEDQVQRGFHYAIVDEVDSVLIDEARTPLIISGPVPGSSKNENFALLRGKVENLVRKQKQLVNDLMVEVEKSFQKEETGEAEDIGVKLLLAQRGDPKNKKFMKLRKRQGLEKAMLRTEADFMREKRLHEFDEELYFVIDEKSNTIDLTEKGRSNLAPQDQEMFVLPDLSLQVKEIDSDPSFDLKEKIRRRESAFRRYAEKNEVIHNFSQLLKAYTLFEKDIEYVVQDGKVLIVDEFTGRLMPGRRFSDGLHQALEAKERVRIGGETQTFATITLQNYFRLYVKYNKLAGMTGTAETEEEEFHKIYELDVNVIPTNKPVRRVDYDDVIFRTKREKYKAIIQEIRRLHELGLPVLVGTVTVDVSETLSRMLQREGIPHNVLNAKQHQREAEIVAHAGRRGAVTIATNMAGRGTDIKLERSVIQCERCCILCETPDECASCPNERKHTDCHTDVPCGLHIIGTERHESRRIDRQLRGRAGRQGDPGSSRFFISLEDELMRLFGSERISSVMDRLGVEEGEVITHPFITKAIEKSQKRVEMFNFGIRKRLIEYDDVMNKQREVIYGRRDQMLSSEDLDEIIYGLIDNEVEVVTEKYLPPSIPPEEWDVKTAAAELESIFLFSFDPSAVSVDEQMEPVAVQEHFRKRAREAYEMRKMAIPPEFILKLERAIMLQSIDEKWMDHLHELDNLKEGIHLRSYAQKDPIIEYKQESFQLFSDMLDDIDRSILWGLFHARFDGETRSSYQGVTDTGVAVHQVSNTYTAGSALPPEGGGSSPVAQSPAGSPERSIRREQPKVGRNDPCPCGSGKKYKKCCGKIAD
ncbi:MAG: preprotein translocase subunit SecA [Candidatus Krumholzibacteriota bacterium]|nr:preprotein translocase subunit SecA [Candidatus Krumholzibacteriota bacterium]